MLIPAVYMSVVFLRWCHPMLICHALISNAFKPKILNVDDLKSRIPFTAVTMKSSICLDITPSTPVEAACFLIVSCLTYSSSLKMEAALSSETPVDFYRTTWRYILCVSNLNIMLCLKL
jgi:hypothetical protein